MIGRCGLAMVALASAAAPQAQTLQCADLSDVAPLENVRFEQDVLPIFEDKLLDCSSCHGGSGGLSLDQGVATHQELFCVDTESSRPQPAGKRVVPGAPMESWLYLRIACDDPNDAGFRMPRNEWLPTTNQLRTIYDWILQGAPSAETIFKSRFDTRGYCPP